jgi:hypothetical protein
MSRDFLTAIIPLETPIDDNPCIQVAAARASLQFRVFGFGLLKDGCVRVGVLPEGLAAEVPSPPGSARASVTDGDP